ncbi:MAG: alpha/beta hydrolase [Flavobacteriaceae bacterium]|nr:alpha/beta hydrolase [Flavobacteriaceae bacterium]
MIQQKKILSEIGCPILNIYGEHDVLVPIGKNIKLWEEHFKNTSKLTIVRLKNAIHGCMYTSTSICSRYNDDDEKFNPELKEAIVNWNFFK